jgi:hypothetical protein
MSAVDRGLGIALAAAAMAGLAWASNVPTTTRGSADAVLRLAWSARPERIERCRRQSDEELANVPQHMRQELVCEGVTAQYRLSVRAHGSMIADQVVRGGGLRQDRRLYVFQELPLSPGETAIDVRFEREAGDARDDQDDNEDEDEDEEKRKRNGTIPRELSLAARVKVAPREVVLVTYDESRRALVVLGRPD